tara:strand:- start:384 stop:1280 length:897 start_codon:yes stop_codon:yes gene_type:complete
MKTAVFSFGRFNPPTIGHEKLIKKVESVASNNDADFYIYPSWSQSTDKDPLPHKVKFGHMKKAFPKYVENIISNKKCKSAIHVLTKLYDAGYDKVMMVVGSDRISEFDRLLNKYNGKKAVHGFYEFSDGVEIVSAGERDPDAQGVEGMSASKLRKVAVDGDFDSFKTGIPNMSDSDKKKMYDDLRKWMNITESKPIIKGAKQMETNKKKTYKSFKTFFEETGMVDEKWSDKKKKKVKDYEEVTQDGTPLEEKDTKYQEFFRKALKKFGVTEPDQLTGEKRKAFYNYVDKNWKAKKETD